MFRRWPMAAIVVVAAGCAAPLRPVAQDDTPAEPVLCLNRAQCDAMWARAQLFIVQKSAFKLQLATDVVLQTFGPMSSSDGLAFLVTREMRIDGSGEIRMSASCGRVYSGCIPSVGLAGRQFVEYVRATQ